jgi:hypothetical protein
MKICALEVPAGFGDPGARLAEIGAARAPGEPADVILGLTVVNANWGQGEPRVQGQGRSRIVGPGGAVEAPRLAGQVSRVSAEILPKPAAPSP